MDSAEYHDIVLRVRGDQEARRLSEETRRANANLRDFARTLDDLQYVSFKSGQGLRPILNNLTEFSPILGAVAIAVDLVIRNWSSLESLWSNSKLDNEVQQMKELGEKTEKTAEETKKLADYEERRRNMKAQAEGKSSAQNEMTSGVNRAIAEAGYENVILGLTMSKLQANPAAINIKDQAARDEAYRKFEAESRQDIQKLMGDAASNPKLLKQLTDTVVNNPDLFGVDRDAGMKFAAGLLDAGPEAVGARRENSLQETRGREKKRLEREALDRKAFMERKMEEMGSQIERTQENFRKTNAQEQAEQQRLRQEAANKTLGSFGRMGGMDALGTLVEAQLRSGANPNEVMKTIGRQIGDRIGDPAKGREVGRSIVESAIGNLMNGQQGTPIRSSQMFDAASFASAIQAGVSNKPTQEAMELQKAVGTLKSIENILRTQGQRRQPAVAG